MGRMRPSDGLEVHPAKHRRTELRRPGNAGYPFTLSGESDRVGSSPERARKEVRNGAQTNEFGDII